MGRGHAPEGEALPGSDGPLCSPVSQTWKVYAEKPSTASVGTTPPTSTCSGSAQKSWEAAKEVDPGIGIGVQLEGAAVAKGLVSSVCKEHALQGVLT